MHKISDRKLRGAKFAREHAALMIWLFMAAIPIRFPLQAAAQSAATSLTAQLCRNIVKDSIQPRLIAMTTREHIPSIALAVVSGNESIIDTAFGYSDLATRTHARNSTVYGIGSVSKVLTGLALMQSRDKGLVNLDKPIRHYIKNFTIQTKGYNGDDITLRSLAMHRSGLPSFPATPETYASLLKPVNAASRDEYVKSLKYLYLLHEPYSAYTYSNLGFNLIAAALERLAKKPFESLVATGITRPLHMTNTVHDKVLYANSLPHAVPYWIGTNESPFSPQPGDYVNAVAPKATVPTASGGYYASVMDMGRLLKALLNPSEYGIISPYTLREMEVTDLVWQKEHLNGVTMYYHIGVTLGYSAFLGYIPAQQIGFAILSNALGFDIGGLGKTCFRQLAWRAKATNPTDFLPDKYLGVYEASDEPDLLKAGIPSLKLVVSYDSTTHTLRADSDNPQAKMFMQKSVSVLDYQNGNRFRLTSGGFGFMFGLFDGDICEFVPGADGMKGIKWRNVYFKKATKSP